MRKVTSLLMLVLVAAIGLSGCGDDVQVTEPDPDQDLRLEVTVTPGQLELSPGATATVTADVTQGSDVTGVSVSWSSGDASVASVSGNGNTATVTGESEGSVAITATVSSDNAGNASASAGVDVEVAEEQAQVSIARVTLFNTNTPVDPNNTFGRVDVTTSVDPGDETVTGVSLFVDDDEVDSQTFSSAQAAELRAQASASEIVFTVNTARVNTDRAGNAMWKNGDRELRVEVTTEEDEGVGASASRTLTFNNADGLSGEVAYTGDDATSAKDANGILWNRGDLTVRALPVVYSDSELAEIAQVQFNVDNGATKSDDEPDEDGFFEVTFPDAPGFVDPNNVGGYQTPNPSNLSTVTMTSADEGGTQGPSGQLSFILDNRAPALSDFVLHDPWLLANANSSVAAKQDWINGGYPFSAGVEGENDTGVGLPDEGAVTVLAGPVGGEFSEVTTGDDLAESQTNTAYNAEVVLVDRLGNESSFDLYENSTDDFGTGFGVDKTVPTAEFSVTSLSGGEQFSGGGIATAPVLGGEQWQFIVSDDFSGFPAEAAWGTLIRRGPGLSASARCVESASVSAENGLGLLLGSGTCFTWQGATSIPADGDEGGDGYYRFSAVVRDRGGNGSANTRSGEIAVDATPPTAGGLSFSPTTLQGGEMATFVTNASDNLDLWRSMLVLDYPEVVANQSFVTPDAFQQIDPIFDDNFATSASVEHQVSSFVRSLQQLSGGDDPSNGANYPTGGTGKPDNAQIVVQDVGTNISTSAVTTIVANVEATNPFSADARNLTRFAVTGPSAATTVSVDGNTANPTDVTLVAEFDVTAALAADRENPFERVVFYAYGIANGLNAWIPLGDAGVGFTAGNPRVHTAQFAWDPGSEVLDAIGAGNTVDIVAVGITGSGDALATQVNSNVTIQQ